MGATKLAQVHEDNDIADAKELVDAAIDNVDRLIGRAVAILADGLDETPSGVHHACERDLRKIVEISRELTNNLQGTLCHLKSLERKGG